LKIHEVNEATTLIMEAAHEDAEIIFGTVIDEAMKDSVKVTVVATGLGGAQAFQQTDSLLQSAQPAQQMQVQPPNAQPAGFTSAMPPAPNAAMMQMQTAQQQQTQMQAQEAVVEEEQVEAAPGLAAAAPTQEGGELARARAIAQRLGITNLTDDEYDVPTYLRRQEREL
jgi:cell division protein FtsZ